MPMMENPFLRGLLGTRMMQNQERSSQIQNMGGLLAIQKANQELQDANALRGAVVMGAGGAIDAPQTLANIMRVNPVLGLKLHTALQKDSQFGKVDPKDYTPESIARFSQTRNHADLVPVRKSEYINTNTHLIPVNPYTNASTGMPIPIGVSPNTSATIGQREREFTNLSAADQQRLSNERFRLGMGAAETFYNTGMTPGQYPAIPSAMAAPTPAPQSAPAPRPAGPTGGWQIPPNVQAQRDADARRIVQAEATGGAGMVPTQSVIPGANVPQAQPQVFVPPGTPMPQPQAARAPMTPRQQAERAAKVAAEQPQEAQAARGVLLQLDNSLYQIGQLSNAPGLSGITGPIAGRLPSVLGSSTNAQAILDTLKPQISMHVLQAMRDASKTGGAVGQVTEREWPRLEAALGALQQAQTTEQFKSNLIVVENMLRRMKSNALSAYESQYGRLDYTTPPFGRREGDQQPATSGGITIQDLQRRLQGAR